MYWNSLTVLDDPSPSPTEENILEKKKNSDPRQFLINNVAGNYSWKVNITTSFFYYFTFIVFSLILIKMLLTGFGTFAKKHLKLT